MLTADQITQFRTLGFIEVPDILSRDETARISRAFDETFQRLTDEGYFSAMETRSFSKVTRGYRRQVVPLFEKDERFYELLDHSELNDVVENLLGEDCILLEPGVGAIFSGDSTWHCDVDGPYDWTWLKCNFYFDEPSPETGAFYFLPGSHLRELGDPLEQALIDGRLGGVGSADVPGSYRVVPKPGSVVIFNQLTRHGYFGGSTPRRAILVNYCQHPWRRWHQYPLLGRIRAFEQHWGERMFTERIRETAGPRRLKRITKPMEVAY